MVVGIELREPLRGHHDIERDNVKHFKRASKVILSLLHLKYQLTWVLVSQFYESLARRAAQNGHAIDVFAGCLDQVGLLEMKSLANYTNGYMILADSYAMSIFKQSFLRIFTKDEQGDLQMGFNATFDVQVRNSGHVLHYLDSQLVLRPRKSSRCPDSSATPSRRTKSRPGSARRRSESDRPQRGRSAPSRPRRPTPSTLKLSLLRGRCSSQAHEG